MPELDIVLKAESRENVGKYQAMKVRDAKKLPAVIYGPDIKENINKIIWRIH